MEIRLNPIPLHDNIDINFYNGYREVWIFCT